MGQLFGMLLLVFGGVVSLMVRGKRVPGPSVASPVAPSQSQLVSAAANGSAAVNFGGRTPVRDLEVVLQDTLGKLPGPIGLVVRADAAQGIVTGEVAGALAAAVGLDQARQDAAKAGANVAGIYSPASGLVAGAGAAAGSAINSALGGGNQVGVDGNDDLRTASAAIAGAWIALAWYGPLGWVGAALATLWYGAVSWVGDENEKADAANKSAANGGGRVAREWEAGVQKYLTAGLDCGGVHYELGRDVSPVAPNGVRPPSAEQVQAACNQALARRWMEEGNRNSAPPYSDADDDWHIRWACDRGKFRGTPAGGGYISLPSIEDPSRNELKRWHNRDTQAWAVAKADDVERDDLAVGLSVREARLRRCYFALQAYVEWMRQPHGVGLDDEGHLKNALGRGLFEGISAGGGKMAISSPYAVFWWGDLLVDPVTHAFNDWQINLGHLAVLLPGLPGAPAPEVIPEQGGFSGGSTFGLGSGDE
jgi:hypothetical protein